MSALTTKPEARPLCTLQEVLSWTPVQDDLTVSTQPLRGRTARKADLPKTLVCHDMKGGYQEDRYTQGVPQKDVYRFFHWSLVDIFVYFSHKLVTIPPSGWIDSAHLHGVSVLGLFITEWEQGKMICEKFLQSPEHYLKLADKLVEIAKYYQFDGWLINIENKINPEQIVNLIDFVRHLTKEMHATNPNAVVIWYDSVTTTGELDWQNELNNKNKIFFDVCDGIFLNYSWNEENLKHNKENCGTRCADVYVGIDVFGRNMMGGGGFNTAVALEATRRNGLSVAIFAFGWVYEKLGKEYFTENEYKFWSKLTEFCPSHGPSTLPFATAFCQGFGQHFYYRGELVHEQPWANLSLQHFQPTSASAYQKEDVPYKLRIYTDKCYCGGGSLQLAGIYTDRIFPTFQLFTSSFVIEEPTFISYTWYNVYPENVDLCIQLALRDSSDKQRVVHLLGCASFDGSNSENDLITHCSGFGSDFATGDSIVNIEWKFPLNVEDLNLHNLHSVHLPLDPEGGWKTRGYILHPVEEEDKETLERIAAEILIGNPETKQQFELLLGNIQIIPLSWLQNSKKPIEVYCIHIETVRDAELMSVSSLLLWTIESAELVDHYCIYCQLEWDQKKETVFVGNTRKNLFMITDLKLTNPGLVRYDLRFIVQEKLHGLKTLDLSHSPHTQISFS